MAAPFLVIITPRRHADVTAPEILEDFADASPSWVFLEEDTTHFMAERDLPSCIVRHRSLSGLSETDFVFRAADPRTPEALALTLLITSTDSTDLPGDAHRHLLAHFLDDFARYLRQHPVPVSVDVYDEASRPVYA